MCPAAKGLCNWKTPVSQACERADKACPVFWSLRSLPTWSCSWEGWEAGRKGWSYQFYPSVFEMSALFFHDGVVVNFLLPGKHPVHWLLCLPLGAADPQFGGGMVVWSSRKPGRFFPVCSRLGLLCH